MKPKYVVWECEECGKEFYREVKTTLVDDVDHVEVEVVLLPDTNGEMEEFPMCACLGGDAAHTINTDDCEVETPRD